MVFKRQVEKAYEVLCANDQFVKTIEQKIDDNQSDVDDDDTINDHDFSLAIKADTNNNEINNMITDLYMENNNKKKSNIKAVSMFDDQQNASNDRKNVTFNINNNKQLTIDQLDKKRKAVNGVESPSKQNPNKKQNTTGLSSDLIQSPINFDSFACDQELKENIFRRIYYILSPEHFQSNGKIPPRGFLLHGPPGCGKTQLVYAVAGVCLLFTSLIKTICLN